ncbi:MAG: hypothetical protein LIO46_02345 [Clostridiales bacterium]|nr:hypothetical protein [Clostridiales bacterium]
MTVQISDYAAHIKPLSCYKGDTITLLFEFFYEDGTPIDLTLNVRPFWYLCPFWEYDNPVLKKDMVISEVARNRASVLLYAEDTEDLDAIKYTQQPILQSVLQPQKYYRRSEGSIVFKENIIHF